MPYQQIEDLPDIVKENLPKHGQEIFRAAFNSAEEQYKEEERAFRVAWSAVKRVYKKQKARIAFSSAIAFPNLLKYLIHR
ncbi:MAG: ChaB family protein [Trichormus sp. ATA11-4-KO1]|jgi:cation transport regulator|nr:ChaB family protein [Trichormus sp. ATA11-4-KO1]